MKYLINLAVVLLMCAPALGQDLVIEGDVKQVTVISTLPFSIRAPEGALDYRWIVSQGVAGQDLGETYQVNIAPNGSCKITAIVRFVDFEAKKVFTKTLHKEFVVGTVTPPAPPPVPPTPPTPPVPVPVKLFRVMFVVESGKNLPIGQHSAVYSKKTRDWVGANTTPDAGFQGWRVYDPQQDSSKDTPITHTMWTAVKPKLTSVPCVAIQVNDVVEIIPLNDNPEAMIMVLDKYKSGNK